jgi:hypothetical protein
LPVTFSPGGAVRFGLSRYSRRSSPECFDALPDSRLNPHGLGLSALLAVRFHFSVTRQQREWRRAQGQRQRRMR